MKKVITALLGNISKFGAYWVIAVVVMGLGFYAPIADHLSVLQDYNLAALKYIASHLPYYFSSPVLVKLRGFVQSDAFLTTEIVGVIVGACKFLKFCFTDPNKQ